MRKAGIFFVVLIFSVMCVGTAMAAGDYGTYNLNFSLVLSEESSWYKLAMAISERMKAETDGKVNIRVFPNEQLSAGNQTKGLEMVMTGSTAIDLRTAMLWAAVEEKIDVLSLPFFFKDDAEVESHFSGPGADALEKAMEARGVKILSFAEVGWFQLFTTTKPILTLEDFKGLKLRLAPVPIHHATFNALGANSVTMSASEMFTALQQGTVEGVYGSQATMFDDVSDVVKYVSMVDMSYGAAALVINLKLWNSMPAELQEIFERVVQECTEEQRKQEKARNAESLKRFEEKGVKVVYVSPEERARMAEATKGVIADTEKKLGKEFMDLFR